MRLEPYNPFDTGPKICFPNLEEGLAPGVGPEGSDAAVVDIDFLSNTYPADIDTQHPPDLGYLPEETSLLLEARCQAWFDIQCSLKAIRGDSPTPSCNFTLPGIPYREGPPHETDTAAPPAQPAEQQSGSSTAYSPQSTASEHASTQHDPDRRSSFAFLVDDRAASPTHPFVQQAAEAQQGHTARQPHQRQQQGMSLQQRARQLLQQQQQDQHWQEAESPTGFAAGNATGAAAAAAAAAASADHDAMPMTDASSSSEAQRSRLSLLLQQNKQQLQMLLDKLDDEPQQLGDASHRHQPHQQGHQQQRQERDDQQQQQQQQMRQGSSQQQLEPQQQLRQDADQGHQQQPGQLAQGWQTEHETAGAGLAQEPAQRLQQYQQQQEPMSPETLLQQLEQQQQQQRQWQQQQRRQDYLWQEPEAAAQMLATPQQGTQAQQDVLQPAIQQEQVQEQPRVMDHSQSSELPPHQQQPSRQQQQQQQLGVQGAGYELLQDAQHRSQAAFTSLQQLLQQVQTEQPVPAHTAGLEAPLAQRQQHDVSQNVSQSEQSCLQLEQQQAGEHSMLQRGKQQQQQQQQQQFLLADLRRSVEALPLAADEQELLLLSLSELQANHMQLQQLVAHRQQEALQAASPQQQQQEQQTRPMSRQRVAGITGSSRKSPRSSAKADSTAVTSAAPAAVQAGPSGLLVPGVTHIPWQQQQRHHQPAHQQQQQQAWQGLHLAQQQRWQQRLHGSIAPGSSRVPLQERLPKQQQAQRPQLQQQQAPQSPGQVYLAAHVGLLSSSATQTQPTCTTATQTSPPQPTAPPTSGTQAVIPGRVHGVVGDVTQGTPIGQATSSIAAAAAAAAAAAVSGAAAAGQGATFGGQTAAEAALAATAAAGEQMQHILHVSSPQQQQQQLWALSPGRDRLLQYSSTQGLAAEAAAAAAALGAATALSVSTPPRPAGTSTAAAAGEVDGRAQDQAVAAAAAAAAAATATRMAVGSLSQANQAMHLELLQQQQQSGFVLAADELASAPSPAGAYMSSPPGGIAQHGTAAVDTPHVVRSLFGNRGNITSPQVTRAVQHTTGGSSGSVPQEQQHVGPSRLPQQQQQVTLDQQQQHPLPWPELPGAEGNSSKAYLSPMKAYAGLQPASASAAAGGGVGSSTSRLALLSGGLVSIRNSSYVGGGAGGLGGSVRSPLSETTNTPAGYRHAVPLRGVTAPAQTSTAAAEAQAEVQSEVDATGMSGSEPGAPHTGTSAVAGSAGEAAPEPAAMAAAAGGEVYDVSAPLATQQGAAATEGQAAPVDMTPTRRAHPEPAAESAAEGLGEVTAFAPEHTGAAAAAVRRSLQLQPTAAAAAARGSPALQRLWSGYKAGFSSLPVTPLRPAAAALQEGVGSPAVLSGDVQLVQHPGADAGGLVDAHTAAAAGVGYVSGGADGGASAAGVARLITSPVRGAASAAFAASGPAAIPAGCYPPSARKLLQELLPAGQKQGPWNPIAAAAAAAGRLEGAAAGAASAAHPHAVPAAVGLYLSQSTAAGMHAGMGTLQPAAGGNEVAPTMPDVLDQLGLLLDAQLARMAELQRPLELSPEMRTAATATAGTAAAAAAAAGGVGAGSSGTGSRRPLHVRPLVLPGSSQASSSSSDSSSSGSSEVDALVAARRRAGRQPPWLSLSPSRPRTAAAAASAEAVSPAVAADDDNDGHDAVAALRIHHDQQHQHQLLSSSRRGRRIRLRPRVGASHGMPRVGLHRSAQQLQHQHSRQRHQQQEQEQHAWMLHQLQQLGLEGLAEGGVQGEGLGLLPEMVLRFLQEDEAGDD